MPCAHSDSTARWPSALLIFAPLLIFSAAPSFAQTEPSSVAPGSAAPATAEIRNATMRFYVALNSVLQGDLAPMQTVWSHRPDVSNLSPAGDRAHGWNDVYAYYRNMSRQNAGAARVAPADIVVVAGTDLGYSVCTENGQVRSPEGPMVRYSQRVTNIFRLEDGKWKLIHHHADANSGGGRSIER